MFKSDEMCVTVMHSTFSVSLYTPPVLQATEKFSSVFQVPPVASLRVCARPWLSDGPAGTRPAPRRPACQHTQRY